MLRDSSWCCVKHSVHKIRVGFILLRKLIPTRRIYGREKALEVLYQRRHTYTLLHTCIFTVISVRIFRQTRPTVPLLSFFSFFPSFFVSFSCLLSRMYKTINGRTQLRLHYHLRNLRHYCVIYWRYILLVIIIIIIVNYKAFIVGNKYHTTEYLPVYLSYKHDLFQVYRWKYPYNDD